MGLLGNIGKKLFGGGRIDESAGLKKLAALGLKTQGLSVIAHQDKKMVSVTGRVESGADKQRLIEAAKTIDGVESVDDRIIIKAPAPPPQPAPEPEPAPEPTSQTEKPSAVQPEPDAADETEEASGSKIYTVQPGDTLSGIAKEHYGDASKYMVIFEANQPPLEDPNKIFPGQELKIPALD